MFVKPKDGLIVRDPLNFLPIPKEGKEVAENQYWRRRIEDGDVFVVSEKKELPKKEVTK